MGLSTGGPPGSNFGEHVMGIFGALTTAVGGLRAESYALENISGNIANSQTTAFKRIDTSFLDLIPQTGNDQQLAGSVTSQSRLTNTIQGGVQSAAVSTYMAINGDGFFAVQKPGNFSDNSPIFTGVNNYTRRGDFSLDKNGYLVNGAGYYLEGVAIDPTTGNPSGGAPTVLKFQNDFLPSQATTKISYRANLASYPLTAKHDASVPGSELLRAPDFANNPQVAGTQPPPYGDNSKPGLSMNDKAGNPITLTTLLKGAPGGPSLGSDFSTTDTITVTPSTGPVQHFVFYDSGSGGSAGAAANTTYLDLATATVGSLLGAIDTMDSNTFAASTVLPGSGAVTLHTGKLSNVDIVSS